MKRQCGTKPKKLLIPESYSIYLLVGLTALDCKMRREEPNWQFWLIKIPSSSTWRNTICVGLFWTVTCSEPKGVVSLFLSFLTHTVCYRSGKYALWRTCTYLLQSAWCLWFSHGFCRLLSWVVQQSGCLCLWITINSFGIWKTGLLN